MSEEPLAQLRRLGWVTDPAARMEPLAGGVSSDIWLVHDGPRRFVVKRALPQLRVRDEWKADVSRNRHEQEFIAYVSRFLPAVVPKILHADPEHGFFAMEYLGADYANWKTLLLEGKADPSRAVRAAQILAVIHRHSWNDLEARTCFATTANFFQLRIEPYLITTGQRYFDLQPLFEVEARRLATDSRCLVHGDYSPKNILIGPDRMVLLDCEVAWFGDPAFDAAFLLNHLFLKALYHSPTGDPFLDLAGNFWQTYREQITPDMDPDLEHRVGRLLLMLMLARVDGKSPVEYLGENQKNQVRDFVRRHLSRGKFDLDSLRPFP